MVPLLVFVFWIGLHPRPFVHAMHATVLNLLRQATPVVTQVAGLGLRTTSPWS